MEEVLLGKSVYVWLSEYGYYVLPFLIIILGPVAGFAAAFLSTLGVFNPLAVQLIWLITTMATDSFLYSVGRYGSRFLEKFNRTRAFLHRIEHAKEGTPRPWVQTFRNHFLKIFILTKISPTVTISEVLSVTAGILKINYKRFFIGSIIGTFLWSGIFVALGFYFGRSVQDISFILDIGGIVIASAVCIFFVYVKFIRGRLLTVKYNFSDIVKGIFTNSNSNSH